MSRRRKPDPIFDVIKRAAYKIRWMDSPRVKQRFTSWPDYVRDSYGQEAAEQTQNERTREVALKPHEIDEIDLVVTVWLPWVQGDQARVIWAIAKGLSLREVQTSIPNFGRMKDGKFKPYSHEYVRWMFLNGLQVIKRRVSESNKALPEKK